MNILISLSEEASLRKYSKLPQALKTYRVRFKENKQNLRWLTNVNFPKAESEFVTLINDLKVTLEQSGSYKYLDVGFSKLQNAVLGSIFAYNT